MVGLTPGDGKKTGDQVIVRFQEGDVEAGKIVQRVHSDKEKPPRVESGEMVFWHEKGQKIFFKNDGSITIQDGGGASHVYDGKGNITKTANDATDSIGGDRKVEIGGKRKDKVGGVWNAIASSGVWPWLMDDDG